MSQSGFKVSTIDQPQGIVYLIEVEKGKDVRDIFKKVKEKVDRLLHEVYQINPQQAKNIRTLAVIMFDDSAAVDDALNYTNILKS